MNENIDNPEKKQIEEYLTELKDIVALETSLCKQEKVAKAYADFTYVPKEPPQYKNRASLGMISLSATWVLFDVFAFFMKYTKVGIGASIFTAALIIFFIVIQMRGMKAHEKLMKEYAEYTHVYELVQQLTEPNSRTRRVLEKLYEKSAVYTRYRNLNAVCAIYDYLETGKATDIYGSESVYKLYDKEMQMGRVPDKSREIENDIISAEQITEYCKEVNRLLDEIEEETLSYKHYCLRQRFCCIGNFVPYTTKLSERIRTIKTGFLILKNGFYNFNKI